MIEILVQRFHRLESLVDGGADPLDVAVRHRPDRVELGFEQLDQLLGHEGVPGQRIVAVLLGEAGRDADPVLPVRPEDLDLAPVQRGERDQAVQGIHLGVAAPHGRDPVYDPVGLGTQLQHRPPGIEHAEVVDVLASFSQHVDRDLFDRAKSERLEQRHERGQLHPAAGLVELHPGEPLPRRLAPDADDEALGGGLQLLEMLDVVDHERPVGLPDLVVVGEARSVLLGEPGPLLDAEVLAQGIEQVVFPGPREPLDLVLERLVRDLRDLHAGFDVHREEDAGALGLAQRQVVVHGRTVEPLEEHLLQSLPEGCAEPLAGEGHDDRDLPPVEVLAHEDTDAPVLLELEQSHDQLPELLGGGQEQLVARERFEELDDLLVVVRPGDQSPRRPRSDRACDAGAASWPQVPCRPCW